MSTTNGNGKSPEEIEREVEAVRANVRSTLGDIRESLSPGQMVDQALDYVRGSGGGDFARNLGRSIRDNPLPVALIGAGIGWLLLGDRMGGGSGSHRRPARGIYTADDLYTDPDTHHVHVAGDPAYEGSVEDRSRPGLGERASAAASSAGGTLHSVAEGARRVVHDARDRIGEAASTAAHYASGTGSTMRHAGGRIRDVSNETRGMVARAIEEQPLIVGAVGLAVGAVLGAALPTTRTENRLFGSTADEVRRQARTMAREGFEEVQETAEEALREVGRTLDEHGVSTRGLADTLGAVTDTVKSTIDPNRRDEDDADAVKTASADPAGSGLGSGMARPAGGTGAGTGSPSTPGSRH